MSQKNFDRLERGQNGAARIMCGDVAWVSGSKVHGNYVKVYTGCRSEQEPTSS